MMTEYWSAAGWILWLGVVASISPCPLTSNIAALAYIARRMGRPGAVVMAGALFAAGQLVAYVGLAALVSAALLGSTSAAMYLQLYLSKALGPIMIVAGVFLLKLLPAGFSIGVSQRLRQHAEKMGAAGAALLGFLLALAFCPTTAALYFGQVLPLALARNNLLLPAAYGLGAALPVMAFATLLAFGAKRLGAAFGKVAAFEKAASTITGLIFIIVGIYLTLVHVYGLGR